MSTSGAPQMDQSIKSIIFEHKSQFVFLILGICAIPLCFIFFQEYSDFRAWMFSFKEPEQGWPTYADFYITLIGAVVSFIASTIMNKLTWNFFYNHCKETNNEKIRLAKTHKAATSFYKGLYFIFAAVWGYTVLKDEPYLPRQLLGYGDLGRIHEGYPQVKWPEGFRPYYLGTMGYHLHQFFVHACQPARNDFVEMMLHHIVTLFLYGFSYLTNVTLGGAVIMFLHDWADIFTSFVRCFTETTFFALTLISVTGMTLSWLYTRVIYLPFVICEACTHDIFHGRDFFTLKFECILLSFLQVLHIYWFFVLLSSIQKFVKFGKVVDMQHRIEERDTEKKKN